MSVYSSCGPLSATNPFQRYSGSSDCLQWDVFANLPDFHIKDVTHLMDRVSSKPLGRVAN
jgi:hypothetical protein